jgi:FKBP-type peptidyl-prolyl cis-trans isomerase
MRNIYLYLLLGLLVFFQFACTDKEVSELDRQKAVDDKLIADFIAENNIEANKDENGIYYQVVNSNPDGETVNLDDIVEVYYRISTLDGRILEARLIENSQPKKFRHASGDLYPVGINIGVGYMRVGEKYKFFIPSHLAFESYGNSLLARNTVLIAEVEVVNTLTDQEQFQLEYDSIVSYMNNLGSTNTILYDDNGLVKEVFQAGNGIVPNSNSLVTVGLERKYLDGTNTKLPQDNGSGESIIDLNYNTCGLGSTTCASTGLRLGILSMKVGEKAQVLVPSYLAFDSYTQVFPEKFRSEFLTSHLNYQDLVPFAIIKYEIELLQVGF